jgi:ADP-ribosylglycohydrolase
MLASIADHDLAACAIIEARLTHHDPVAGETAAIVNKWCRALIRGTTWQDVMGETTGFTVRDGPGTNSGFAPDVLRAAAYFVGTSASFSEALERSLAFAGAANYCPVLAGAIAGARRGASEIPSAALSHVSILPRVRAAAEALATAWTG